MTELQIAYKAVQMYAAELEAQRNHWQDLAGKWANELAELEAWKDKAFLAHPNIDLDIKAMEK